MDSIKRAVIFINPRAGSGDAEAFRHILASTLLQHGWESHFIQIEKGSNTTHLVPLLREEAMQGTSLVIACGGDGTASLVASTIIESGLKDQLRLGIFPSGTANMLSKELGIPSDWAMAAQILCTMDTTTALDAMKMGENYYFLRIGLGVDAETIRDTSRDAKRRLGRWAYFRSFMGRLFRPHRVKFRCVVDGRRHRFWAVQVFIANGGIIALVPFRIGPGISYHDGELNLCAYDAFNWWDYFTLGWKLLRRNYQDHPLMKFYTIRHSVSVQASPSVPVQGDGENRTQTPVTINVLPGAIRVIAPSATA